MLTSIKLGVKIKKKVSKNASVYEQFHTFSLPLLGQNVLFS